ncbi:MAG: hypothetical protein EXR08_04835 [Alphaproteobacteria bacterium]|nr:hypothetical protein [Alphaproteobacteria bacterium]
MLHNIRDLWARLDSPTRHAITRTAMWIVLIVGTVYTISRSDLMQDYAALAVKVEMPDKIVFPKSNSTVTLPVSLKLKNNTRDTVVLEVPSPCHIIRWYVTGMEGEFIQAPAEEACAQVVMRANLPAGHFSEDELTIPLDAQRYHAGQRYKLMLNYWGQDGSHEFEMEME